MNFDRRRRKFHLRWLDKFLNGVDLATIKRDLLDRIMAARIAEGVANSSVNRVMEVVRAILRKAANEWGWLDRAPSLRMLPEPKRRVRFMTQSEADRLITTLPEHLAAMGEIFPRDGFTARKRRGLGVVPGRSRPTHRMDSPGSSQGQKSNCSTVEWCRCHRHTRAVRQASDTCV